MLLAELARASALAAATAATEPEQRFLVGLLLGELRQGALEGVMVEAEARAAEVPASGVRRAHAERRPRHRPRGRDRRRGAGTRAIPARRHAAAPADAGSDGGGSRERARPDQFRGKGMTDAMLAWQTERLLELETHRDRHTI